MLIFRKRYGEEMPLDCVISNVKFIGDCRFSVVAISRNSAEDSDITYGIYRRY